MSLSLRIFSSLITEEKMQNAIKDAFEKSTGGNAKTFGEEKSFLAVFGSGVTKGDVFDFVHKPDLDVQVCRNEALSTRITGLPFKMALLGIWLSAKPVRQGLRKGLPEGK